MPSSSSSSSSSAANANNLSEFSNGNDDPEMAEDSPGQVQFNVAGTNITLVERAIQCGVDASRARDLIMGAGASGETSSSSSETVEETQVTVTETEEKQHVTKRPVQYAACPCCRAKVCNKWLLGVKEEPAYVEEGDLSDDSFYDDDDVGMTNGAADLVPPPAVRRNRFIFDSDDEDSDSDDDEDAHSEDFAFGLGGYSAFMQDSESDGEDSDGGFHSDPEDDDFADCVKVELDDRYCPCRGCQRERGELAPRLPYSERVLAAQQRLARRAERRRNRNRSRGGGAAAAALNSNKRRFKDFFQKAESAWKDEILICQCAACTQRRELVHKLHGDELFKVLTCESAESPDHEAALSVRGGVPRIVSFFAAVFKMLSVSGGNEGNANADTGAPAPTATVLLDDIVDSWDRILEWAGAASPELKTMVQNGFDYVPHFKIMAEHGVIEEHEAVPGLYLWKGDDTKLLEKCTGDHNVNAIPADVAEMKVEEDAEMKVEGTDDVMCVPCEAVEERNTHRLWRTATQI